MNIAVVSAQVFPVPPPGYSGLEMIAYQCARGLALLGHRITLFAPDGSTCPGVRVAHTGPPGQWDEKAAYGGGEALDPKGQRKRREGYWSTLLDEPPLDAIIDHSWQKWSYLLKAEGRLKCPVLGVMHAPINTMLWANDMPVEKACVVCISKDAAAHFEALYTPRHARHCYNGIDLDFYKPIEGIKWSGRFLFLARFSTIKGPDLAIDACRKAGVGLDLVGDTSITNEPQYFADCANKCDDILPGAGPPRSLQFGKVGQIRMVGPASRGECVHWFSQAHCLLHPNLRFREPFGLAPVEAMACGCPVIAFDNGAMRETCPKGVGWLVRTVSEFEDCVKEYGRGTVHDRSKCREWASQFSVRAMCKRYEQLCQEAIDTGGW